MTATRIQSVENAGQRNTNVGFQGGARRSPNTALEAVQQRADQSSSTRYLNTMVQRAAKFKAPHAQGSETAQRVRDLDAIYAAAKYDNDPESGNNDKAQWLDLFKEAQAILRNGDNLREALRQLSSEMAQTGRTLARSLAMHLNAADQRRVFLTGFVPPDAFTKLVREDQYLFEDFVRKEHGVYSHQLQFYILLHNMGEPLANLIRRESLNARWISKGPASMWDNIVDGTDTHVDKIDDLTVPNNVTAYIIETLRNEQGHAGRALASDEVARSDAEHQQDRTIVRSRYPNPKTFTGFLKTAQKRLRKLSVRRNTRKAKATDDDEALQLGAAIMHEKMTNTTDVNGEVMTVEWTGWIRKGDKGEITLEPTIGKVV